ncbi:hypothetical protein CFter6_2912 [Collimonas fungivorans]|uniref:Uncharacterized protein n=2 Tax=Collimonas fungivorans TaxID=158899 RepID=A0A127PCQ6_9BURK|nr:hypothetical protein CFter6_2912 [Collimonas fungivorans]
MERAQMQNWLKHPAPAAAAHRQTDISDAGKASPGEKLKSRQLVSPVDVSEAKTAVSTKAVELSSSQLAPRMQFAVASKAEAPVAGEQLLPQDLLRQLRQTLTSPLSSRTGFAPRPDSVTQDRQQLLPGSALDGANASDEQRQPLRVHAQWSGRDVQLWLGVDGQAALSSSELMQIVRESRSWLSAQGGRLLSVTCNGQAVYMAPDAGQVESTQTATTIHKQSQPGKSSTSGFSPIYSYFDSQEA